MSHTDRVIKTYAKSSDLNFGNWADQNDFRPEVQEVCTEYKATKTSQHTSVTGFTMPRSAKVIIIGAPGIGKTSLVLRYCRDVFERNYKTTIGVDFEVEKFNVLGVPFNMQIWDTAGAERFKGVTTAYFRGAQIVMLAYDFTSDESLYRTGEWLLEAQEFCVSDFDIFLVACKKDLVADEDYEQRVRKASEFADKYGAEFWHTSSKTAENVDELFTRVATVAFERIVVKEIEAAAAPRNGQLAQHSTLIRIDTKPSHSKHKSPKKKPCCAR